MIDAFFLSRHDSFEEIYHTSVPSSETIFSFAESNLRKVKLIKKNENETLSREIGRLQVQQVKVFCMYCSDVHVKDIASLKLITSDKFITITLMKK